jgi:cell division protein FtsB
MKSHRKSILLKLAACAFAVYIAATLIYQTVQIRQSNDQLARLKAQVADQQEENAQTERVLAENDEQFMESVARNDLGYAKPNERIFVDASGN